MNPISANRYRVNLSIKLGIIFASLLLFPILAKASAPVEATFSNVENCQLLGKVEGSSGYGKNNGWEPLARFSATRLASGLGASHIVFERFIPIGAFNGVAVARAYKCN